MHFIVQGFSFVFKKAHLNSKNVIIPECLYRGSSA